MIDLASVLALAGMTYGALYALQWIIREDWG